MRGARVSMSVLSCPKSSWAVSAPLTLSARRAPTETRGLETALSLACVCVALCAPGDRRYVTCVVCVPRFVGFGEKWFIGLRFDFVCAIHSRARDVASK